MSPRLPIAGLPDQESRRRIRDDLGTNLLVEAGAGSGKTSELVHRMLSLVEAGRPVERIAAVTFTRKAAGELAQRFREELEGAIREAEQAGGESRVRLRAAQEGIDRAFIGTIHAFCARLLREHAVEAGIDPGFMELSDEEARRLRRAFWVRRLDELHASADPTLRRVLEVGIDPEHLLGAFQDLVDDVDVVYRADPTEPPAFEAARRDLEALLERGLRVLGAKTVQADPDGLQRALRQLVFLRRTTDWSSRAAFFAALDVLDRLGRDVTLNRWFPARPSQAPIRDLRDDVREFLDVGEGAKALDAWRVHRYAIVMDFLRPIVTGFAESRRRSGQLTFTDLLAGSADLLANDAEARRDLGERYRYLLVDEFQDTDPLQAAVCFLLSSPPEDGPDWRGVRPREGALFVVGDPKQSIYRFRRADIDVYGAVRERMRSVGDVLLLTCNFRSRAAIGTFVDAAFEDLFARADAEGQADFAPTNTRPDRAGGGVLRHEITFGDRRDRAPEVARLDAERVASWIAVRAGDPPDYGRFLVLTHRKKFLQHYARALESRNIPVTATGMGLHVERELRELIVLLRALADPGDPVATVAALEGLFFGLDLERLLLHREQGRSFSFDRREFDSGSDVERALETMHRWAGWCRDLPADAAIERIVSEAGLLPLAAGGEMGDSGAGSLVHVFEIVAAAALRGAADVKSAIEAIEAAMQSVDVEAPLRPGRPGAVRLMNVHKAKGLEAPIVVLACPAGHWDRKPTKHVSRPAGREPEGWLHVKTGGEEEDDGEGRTLAWPRGWAEYERREETFERAENRRVLYVAATRAAEELVVAERPECSAKSFWGELGPALAAHATLVEMPGGSPAPRGTPNVTKQELALRISELEDARARAAEPAFAVATVTASAKRELELRGGEGRGRTWGSIVHQAIAQMGRGRGGESLRRYVRALLLGAERPRDGAGEPLELGELMSLLERVRAGSQWRTLTGSGAARWELAVTHLQHAAAGVPALVTGTLDAAAVGDAGLPWRVVDWKTDAAEGDEWSAREWHYRQQVDAYAEILQALSGGSAEGTIERVR
ncbi:MAG: UvrD-helicase domain-containing protein [Gemmatimonadota bacterium]